MFRRQDPHAYSTVQTLYVRQVSGKAANADTFIAVGFLTTDYVVNLYNDVQAASGQASIAPPTNQQFLVNCTQTITITNTNNTSLNPIAVKTAADEYFKDYPALLSCNMHIDQDETSTVTFNLLDYSPKTVNTAVQQNTANTTSSGTSNGTSNSSTTGSSMSESSTYGTSVTLGDSFSGVSANYEHTSTSTSEQSKTTGSESSRNSGKDASSSASMSIKNWGAYASVDPQSVTPKWVFGQEYPWNAIECRYYAAPPSSASNDDTGKVQMYISNSMMANLYDGVFLYPPSELSQFGLNFVMKASWRVYVPFAESTVLQVNTPVSYYTASHYLATATAKDPPTPYVPQVFLDQQHAPLYVKAADGNMQEPFLDFDMNIMALDPVGLNAKAAVVGFIPSRFIPPVIPASTPVATAPNFKILSNTNDLQILDTTVYAAGQTTGFAINRTCLTATWSATNAFPYALTLYFKIYDSVDDYVFYIKSWKTTDTGVQLKFIINGDEANAITKYVDAMEAEGGDNNLISVNLRNLDFLSVDYHDFLQLGLNSIQISVQPIDAAYANCAWQIRAISVEKA